MGFDAFSAAAFQAITTGILHYGRFIDNDIGTAFSWRSERYYYRRF